MNTYIPTQYDYSKFKLLDKEIGFKTIIFSHTDQTPWAKAFLGNLVKDNNWKIVYIDSFMVVLVRSDSNLAQIDLNKLNPKDFNYINHASYLRMSFFLLTTGNIDSGRRFLEKTLQIFPNSPVANSILGNNVKNNFFW